MLFRSTLTPAARSAAVDLFLSRRDSLSLLLERMQSGIILPASLSIDQRLPLLQNPDKAIQETARKLFGGTVSADRRKVAEEYAAALQTEGDPQRGALVFERTCSKCHRIGSVGQSVGPDISDTRARAADALLYDILDPNRRVDPQFSEYVVVTTDGRLLNGLLVSETPQTITLRQAEGRESSLNRSDVEELRATNRSLMPEGIEKDVTITQMADILAFLLKRSGFTSGGSELPSASAALPFGLALTLTSPPPLPPLPPFLPLPFPPFPFALSVPLRWDVLASVRPPVLPPSVPPAQPAASSLRAAAARFASTPYPAYRCSRPFQAWAYRPAY